MPNQLRGRFGEVESNTDAGPTSYPTGGFSIATGLGRISTAMVESDSGSYELRVQSTPTNNIVTQAFSAGTTNEVAAGTDLSGVTVTYTATRL